VDTLLQDLRFGLRLLWKDKGFTAAAVLTLAVCLGANAALFTVVDTVLLRPLPFRSAGRLVAIHNAFPNVGFPLASTSVPDYVDRLHGMPALDALAIYRHRDFSIEAGGRPEQVDILQATPSLFRLLEAAPAIGRLFTEEDAEVGHEHEAIISYATWQQMFGGRPDVLGRDIRIADVPYTIVGVMRRGFWFINPAIRVWTPAAFTPEEKSEDNRLSENWNEVGRLKPGVTIQQAQAQLDALNANLPDRLPQYRKILEDAGYHSFVVPLQADLVRNVKAILYLLWGGALFVLLIGAVNIANLTLVRSRARLRELATRAALGAGRLRLARQLVTESLVVALAGGGLGLLGGYAALRLFGALDLGDLPRAGAIHLDAATAAFSLGLAALVGLLVATIPVSSVLRAELSNVFHEDARTGTAGRSARVLRRLLVVTQVAVAFVLLVGAGLLLASFRQAAAVNPGFDPHGVLIASVRLPDARYTDDAARRLFARQALDRIRALPGVASAGATDAIPLGGNHDDEVIMAEGYRMKPGESVISPNAAVVTPGYFQAMRIPLVRGRFFDAHDTPDAPRVIIVDERLARHFWPDRDPLGHRMFMPTDPQNLTAVTPKTKFFTVVGVVHHVAMRGIADNQPDVGTYYFPFAQQPQRAITFAVRTSRDPVALAPAVRRTVASVDPELPVYDVQTMRQLTDHALLSRRSPLMLSVGFGAMALLLAAIGIYGVLAYLVTQRTREIGIRIALGSTRRRIFDLILREGLVVVGAGLVLGLAGAFALSRGLQSQLYRVQPTDPRVFAGTTAVLGAVALAACLLPAGRATRINPITALRQE